MATYNWYFSQSGNDSTGDGSSGNPWKTLAKAQTEIDTAGSADTVNLFFNRGDTWTMDTDAVVTTPVYGLTIGSDDPGVNIDAYGTGVMPKFYGTISSGGTWFDTVPVHNVSTGPLKWNRIFQIQRDYCSFKNIHVDGVYGKVFYTPASSIADNITIESCHFTNIGNGVLLPSTSYGTRNSIFTKNLVAVDCQLCRYNKTGGSCAPFSVSFGPWTSALRSASGNLISYNTMYDIYGEGIHGFGYTAEYNLIGDTGSAAIYVCPSVGDATDTVVRYNFITMSNSAVYRAHQFGHHGIGIVDEGGAGEGGDNTNATAEVYGNIVINRRYGIYVSDYVNVPQDPWGAIKIFNNTVIDSDAINYYIHDYKAVLSGNGFIYNNSSILYDRPGSTHVLDQDNPIDLSTYWTIDNNHYWTIGGSPTVDSDWQTNMVTTDPKLPGEDVHGINWIGQSGATYYKDIDFDTHLYPPADSGLVGTGKTLGVGFENTFLTLGTDFGDLPDTQTFNLLDQPANWDIGAIVRSVAGSPYTRHRGILRPKPSFNTVGGRF